jgi:hypothetical protein
MCEAGQATGVCPLRGEIQCRHPLLDVRAIQLGFPDLEQAGDILELTR